VKNIKFRVIFKSKIIGTVEQYSHFAGSGWHFVDYSLPKDERLIESMNKLEYILGVSTAKYEQFTGLKDKNGTEMYEGDICLVFTSYGKKAIAHICFVDGCFELCFLNPVVIDGEYRKRDYLKCFVVNHAIEIIGNIHENPELLDAE